MKIREIRENIGQMRESEKKGRKKKTKQNESFWSNENLEKSRLIRV